MSAGHFSVWIYGEHCLRLAVSRGYSDDHSSAHRMAGGAGRSPAATRLSGAPERSRDHACGMVGPALPPCVGLRRAKYQIRLRGFLMRPPTRALVGSVIAAVAG